MPAVGEFTVEEHVSPILLLRKGGLVLVDIPGRTVPRVSLAWARRLSPVGVSLSESAFHITGSESEKVT